MALPEDPAISPEPWAQTEINEALFTIARKWTEGNYGRMVAALREAFAAGYAKGLEKGVARNQGG